MKYGNKAVTAVAFCFLLWLSISSPGSAQDIKAVLSSTDNLLVNEEPFAVINQLKTLSAPKNYQFKIQNRLAEAYLLNREFAEAGKVLDLQEPEAAREPELDRAYYFLNEARYFFETSDYASAHSTIDSGLGLLKSRNDIAGTELWANSNLMLGRIVLQQGYYLECEKIVNASLAYFNRNTSRFAIKIGQCHLTLGSCLKAERRMPECEQHFQLAIKIFKASSTPRYYDLGRAYNNLGNAYNDLSFDYKNAQACYLTALDIKTKFINDSLSLAITHSNLGNFYKDKGNYLKSKEHYEKSMALCNEKNPRYFDQLPKILSNYGSILFDMGQLEKAKSSYARSIDITIKKEGQEATRLMGPYLSLGACYAVERNIEELQSIVDKIQVLLKESFNENDLNYARFYELKGNLTGLQNKQNEALDLYSKAWTIWQYNSAEKSNDAILLLQNLSEVKMFKGNYSDAITSFHKVIKTTLQAFGTGHIAIRSSYNDLAYCFMRLNHIDSSIFYLNKAIEANFLKSSGITDPKFSNRIIDPSEMISSYYFMSMVYKEKYKASSRIEDLLLAAKFIDLGDDLIESTRRDFESTADQITFNQSVEAFFEQALNVYFELHRKFPDDPSYLNAAFANFELAKAQSLAQALKKLKINSFAGVSQSLADRENTLTDRIRYLDNQLVRQLRQGNKSNPDLINEYNSDYREAIEKYKLLTDSIKGNLPDYYQFKYEKSLVNVDDIQREVIRNHKEVALVEFLFGDSSLFCQVITPGMSALLKFGNPKSIRNRIVSLRNQVKYKLEPELYINAYALYRELFYPVDSLFSAKHLDIKQIIVIPDNILNYLPFEILIKSPVAESEKPHFLLSDYGISYSYSSTLLWQKSTDVSMVSKPNHSFVGFAPLFLASGPLEKPNNASITRDESSDRYFQNFQPLQSNVEEVSQISESFKKQKDKSLVLEGTSASESYLFSQDMAEFGYVHFATHGFVDMDQPQYSGIAFTRNSGSLNPADGILFTNEIYKLRLKAELVCISSCDSGLGKFYKGEGIVGLSRAFLYAGARNLTVSLWKVDDLATSQLMIQYYKEIEKGRQLSQSLTQAKRKMLSSEKFHHPYYWASFILVGQ